MKEWRKARIPHLKQWMDINQKNFFVERMQLLKKSMKEKDNKGFYDYVLNYIDYSCSVLNKYQNAYLQDYYQMTINYEEGQTLSFYEKDEVEAESILDIFPPLMFCEAASERSRQFICVEYSLCRKGITIDHPFVIWLLENAFLLNQYFQRQFQQIVDCLCGGSGKGMIQTCNHIRQQLMGLPEHHGVDVRGFPQLSMEDFWVMEDLD